MIAMLFAGQHTSSITSSWTILYLVQPENERYLYAAGYCFHWSSIEHW
jgi:cytochrome P450